MMTFFQAIIIGLVQGVTELFPVSSLGHSVLIPALLGWQIQNTDTFLVFLVAVHFATAIVLIIFFFQDWVLIVKGFFRSIQKKKIDMQNMYEKLAWLIIIASIPAGLLGFLFQKKIETLISSAELVSIFLIINGILLYSAEILRKHSVQVSGGDIDGRVAKISWLNSFTIGCAECLALIPGFSRTGSALGAGLLAGLDHEAAARFSFLLAAPLILAASVLKLPELFHMSADTSLPILFGALAAAVGAYVSVKFLSKYFKTNTLTPFAIYCMIAGLITFVILR